MKNEADNRNEQNGATTMTTTTNDRETLAAVVADLGIKIQSVKIDARPDLDTRDKDDRGHWAIFLGFSNDRLFPFGYYSAGPGHRVAQRGKMVWPDPKVADVLGCLASDASGADQPFKDWASDLGYEMQTHADWKRARKTWKACRRTRKALAAFLGTNFDRVLAAEW